MAQDASTVKFLANTHPLGRGASQSVYRYSYLSVAQNRYEEMATLAGSTPQEWNYQSAIADESIFVCYDYEGTEPYPLCTWVVRFHEYVVVFNAWLLPERMALKDLEEIMRAIDERMAQYVSK